MHAPDPHRPDPAPPAPEPGAVNRTARPGPAVVDPARPFGAHLRMSWWKPLVLLVTLPVVLVLTQWSAFLFVGVLVGSDDPLSTEFTPEKALAANLAIGVTGLVAVLMLVWLSGVPWRALFSHRRAFDGLRLARYSVGAALVVGAAMAVVAVVAPESAGWTGFAITGTTLALLAVTLLTTPFQAAGEELMFRSVLLPAAASWLRAVRPALVLGLVVSSLGFAAVHGSTDPWLAGYFTVVGLSTGLMAIISGGMEAPIAFHVVNNVIAGVLTNVMAGGGTSTIDRATDTGGPSLLILAVANVAMVAVVWFHERRARPARLAG